MPVQLITQIHILLTWEKNLFINNQMHAKLNFCYMQSEKQHECTSTVALECSTWSTSTPHQISSYLVKSCARKWSLHDLFSTDLVTRRRGEGHWKWHEMVKVKDVQKHGRYVKNLVEKFVHYYQLWSFALCNGQWPASQVIISDYIGPLC